jgi:hypothetical protein
MAWRLFFIAAALYNLAAGLPLLVVPGMMLAQMGGLVPDDLLYHRVAGLLILCFGALYAMVARDPARFGPMVWLGVVGKTGVILMVAEAYLAGRVPLSGFAVALGDLVFVLGFVGFLVRGR